MKIARISPISHEINEKDLDITEEQLSRYMRGEHVQRVFPHLSAPEREFILTGITEEEWNEMFPPEDEENELQSEYMCSQCGQHIDDCECQ